MFLDNLNKENLIEKNILFFKKLFEDNFLFEIQRIDKHLIDNFENDFIGYAKKYNISLIASNNIKYENKYCK